MKKVFLGGLLAIVAGVFTIQKWNQKQEKFKGYNYCS